MKRITAGQRAGSSLLLRDLLGDAGGGEFEAVEERGDLAALRGLIADGKSVTEAARILKTGRSTAYAALAARTA